MSLVVLGQREGPVGVVEVLARTPEGTAACGAAVGRLLRPGDVVLLGGELGAGKTTFTQGLARALGVEGAVTSPTFVLVHSYPTKAGWDLVHADVWRLQQLQEVIDLAIPELIEQGAAAVIEWGEKAAPALPSDCLHVAIGYDEEAPGAELPGPAGAEGVRRLELKATGPGWEGRLGELARHLAGGQP